MARIVFTLLIIGVVLWGVGEVSAVLVPFFMAWLYVPTCLCLWCVFEQRLKIKSRGLSLLIVLLLLGGILTGIVAIVVPSITEEAKKAWELMQYYDLQGVVLSMLPEELRSRTGIVERLGGYCLAPWILRRL